MVDILNEDIFKSRLFLAIKVLFKEYYKKLNTVISYDDFKKVIVTFTEYLMNKYLEDTSFYNDNCSCVIDNLSFNIDGKFINSSNTIAINDKVVKSIYNGNIFDMSVIFHELNHFKEKYDLLLGKINIDLARILKETLLTSSDCGINKNFGDYMESNNYYYECNYSLFSSEKLAEINGIKNLILFLDNVGITLNDKQINKFNKEINKNISQYNNYLRDFRFDLNFNNYFLDFEEAFDVIIKCNPNWVSYPLISVEYCIDENGNVRRKTKEELEKMLKEETDSDVLEYIKRLITPSCDKRLSKYDFKLKNSHKLEEMLNSKENRKYSNFKR